MGQRFFDIVFSFIGIILLSPIFLIISIIIVIDNYGSVFFLQERIGIKKKTFKIYKFRTMSRNSEIGGLLTVGNKDKRITRFGFWLRKLKLDELPQLFNVLKGEMSLVGPRPEVKKYVDLYTIEQLKILNYKPGITDIASIEYFAENEILAKSENAEKTYVEVIMQEKIRLNMRYIENYTLDFYFLILYKTLIKYLVNEKR